MSSYVSVGEYKQPNRQFQPEVVTAGTEVAQGAMLTVGKIKGESKRAIPNLKNKKKLSGREKHLSWDKK